MAGQSEKHKSSQTDRTPFYGSETRPLLADVWVKFEGAPMTMIRWICVVSMKDRRTSE